MSRRLAAFATVAVLLDIGLASAAPRANGFDGLWTVEAVSGDGACSGAHTYPIVIRGGEVDDAGGNGADASGRAAPDGRITGTIRSGLANVAVTGRLRGASGKGRWTLTGPAACSGRWSARRTG